MSEYIFIVLEDYQGKMVWLVNT